MFWRKKKAESKRTTYNEVTDVLTDFSDKNRRAVRRFIIRHAGGYNFSVATVESKAQTWHALMGMGMPGKTDPHPLDCTMRCVDFSVNWICPFEDIWRVNFYYKVPTEPKGAKSPTEPNPAPVAYNGNAAEADYLNARREHKAAVDALHAAHLAYEAATQQRDKTHQAEHEAKARFLRAVDAAGGISTDGAIPA